jgi:hypothetical protein
MLGYLFSKKKDGFQVRGPTTGRPDRTDQFMTEPVGSGSGSD